MKKVHIAVTIRYFCRHDASGSDVCCDSDSDMAAEQQARRYYWDSRRDGLGLRTGGI